MVGPPIGLTTCIRPPTADDALGEPGEPAAGRDAARRRRRRRRPRRRAGRPARLIETDGAGRPGVLGHVGQRLGDDEVDGALDRRRRALRHVDRQRHRHRAAGDDRRQRGVEPAVLEDRGVEAAHEVAQLGQRLLGLLVRAGDELQRAVGIGGELLLGPAEVHAERDQPLLRAVVQVALDAAALGLGAVERGGAARVELLDPGLERVAARARRAGGGRRTRSGRPSRPSSTARAATTPTTPTDREPRSRAPPAPISKSPNFAVPPGSDDDVERQPDQRERPAPGDDRGGERERRRAGAAGAGSRSRASGPALVTRCLRCDHHEPAAAAGTAASSSRSSSAAKRVRSIRPEPGGDDEEQPGDREGEDEGDQQPDASSRAA